MGDPVLKEFNAKINKAKIIFETTRNQCESLRREAGILKRVKLIFSNNKLIGFLKKQRNMKV